jgi:hypothetical protein
MESLPTNNEEVYGSSVMQDERSKASQTYSRNLRNLSVASVKGKKVYNPYQDIDWSAPIDPHDPRFVLGDWHPLGAHDWYKTKLSDERRAEIGLKIITNACAVGYQFEELLVSGLMHFHDTLPPDSDEARYIIHECTEETWHIQMFRELVKHTGLKPKGAPAWFRNTAPYLTPLAKHFPVGFMEFVIGGEEPADTMQHAILDQDEVGDGIHPTFRQVMKIHTDEEARHIRFAELYLDRHIRGKDDKMTRKQKAGKYVLSILTPFILSLEDDVMVKPSKQAIKDMDIDEDVVEEVWGRRSEYSRRFRRDRFKKARELATRKGMLNSRLARATWKYLGIDDPNPSEQPL